MADAQNTNAQNFTAPEATADSRSWAGPEKGAGEASTTAPQSTPPAMDPAQRSLAAMARRQAQAEAQGRYSAALARQETFAQSRGYSSFEAMEAANRDEQLRAGSVTTDTLAPIIREAVEQHPLIRQVRDRERQAIVDKSLEEFRSAFPEAQVRTVDDFLGMPTWDEFYRLVGQGLSYVEAYKLANDADIQARRAASAKQAALNQLNGKSHMKGTEATGEDPAGHVVVPAATMGFYRNFFPNWTEAQIRGHYARSQKE